MKLFVGGVIERSRANGPGERFVIWVQGCSLGCAGCFNPGFWPAKAGALVETESLARRINQTEGIRGLTISGGEPLEQSAAVADLLDNLDRRLDTVIFTGFAPDEIARDPGKSAVLRRADLIVAGRYVRDLSSEENAWAGSSNKAVIALTGRIAMDEIPACRVEVFIGREGGALITGFPS